MQTSKQTLVRRLISLNGDEEFLIKPPTGHVMWRIRIIEVLSGHFVVYGGPRWGRGRSGCLQVNRTYSSTDELPNLPFSVAEEIHRCYASFKAEGGYLIDVVETPSPTVPATQQQIA